MKKSWNVLFVFLFISTISYQSKLKLDISSESFVQLNIQSLKRFLTVFYAILSQ